MKVIVKDYLNVRVGKPSLNAPNFQYLAPGSELEVDGETYMGESYEGNKEWMKDVLGNYYWKGGLIINKNDSWYQKLGIINIWEDFGERGNGAKILILDSGINDELNCFANAIVGIETFISGNRSTKDKIGHGTHCAGLIAARSSYNVGIAPESQLLIGKITDTGRLYNANTLKEALKEYLNETQYDFDIISLSVSVNEEDLELRELINKHMNNGKIIITAIGNDPLRNNDKLKRYPGFYSECISVGSCEFNTLLSPYTCSPERANIFCFGTSIGSFKNQNFPEISTGTSQSTAIVAGVCALIVAFLKKNNKTFNQESIKLLLEIYSSKLRNHPHLKLINPLLIFTKLLKFNENDQITDLHTFIDHESMLFL